MRSREEALATFPILAFFTYEHLPQHLQAVSAELATAAFDMAMMLPVNAETSAGLRKLLEAKDCFVRAAIPKKP